MFSIKQLTEDSYPVAVIVKKSSKKVKETIFYTEPTRTFKRQKIPFEKQIEYYLDEDHDVKIEDILKLKDSFQFEMVPTCSDSEKMPRFINYYLSASNSGKSYQIAALCKRYLQQFPKNVIAYASANDITNDKNYDEVREKIKIVDVLNLQSTIDFSQEDYHNSMWIFDDCDSGFTVSMTDLDNRLTKEELDKLSVTDKQKALKMLKAKCETASEWVSKSIQSFMMNGRKFRESLCIVGHKPFEGRFENKIVGEATGIILFPASMKKNLLKRFIVEKLSFEKEDGEEMLKEIEWFQYDWLFLSHRSSRPFIITPDLIKIYES